MTRKKLLVLVSAGLCGVGAFSSLNLSRAGNRTLLRPAQTRATYMLASAHPFNVNPEGVATQASFRKPLMASPNPDPDRDAMDNILVRDWAETFYQDHRPKLKKEHINAPYVALTFDDGPKPWGTAQILDHLEKYQAHATFFVVGSQCAKYPALLSRISNDGNEIGNHTYTHRRLPTIPITEVGEELERTRTLVRRLTGQTTYLFRPPGGRTNAQVQTMADSLGYTTVFWAVDSSELEKNMNPEKVFRRVVDNIHSGDIVLLHNGDPNIVAALPRILNTLSQRGYQFITVSELTQMSGATPVAEPLTPRVDVE